MSFASAEAFSASSCIGATLTVVSFRATVWSRHATRSLSSRCVTRANKGYEGGYASMQDLIIGIWSRALLRPRERMRSSET